jgi:hypothetical protein
MSILKTGNLFSYFAGLLCACSMFLCSSCSDSPDSSDNSGNTGSKEYGIWVQIKTDKTYNYLLTVSDLMKDTIISPLKSGIDTEGNIDGTYGTAKGGYYYYPSNTKISKLQITNGKFVEVDNCIVDDGDYSSLMMKAYWNDYLNVLGWAGKVADNNTIEKKIYQIKVGDMTVLSKNTLKFPVPENLIKNPDKPGEYLAAKDLSISPTSFTIIDNKAFVGFVYWDWDHWIHTDDAYMLVCDYPSLENVKVLKESNYGYMSGTWWQSSSSFVDSKGDLYFTTVNADNKYTLLRIKKGETQFDEKYVYDLKDYNIYIEGYGGQYDHHTYIKDGLTLLNSYVVDVWNKKVIVDLNTLGFGKVQEAYSGGILVEDGKLYVVMKTANSRWYVCQYNPDTNKMTRGLEIDGGVSSVGRIDKFK